MLSAFDASASPAVSEFAWYRRKSSCFSAAEIDGRATPPAARVTRPLAALVSQVMLSIAFLCTLLLWVEASEWGALLLLYGLWARHTFSPRHLAAFTCLLCLNICTDALVVAGGGPGSDYATVLTWGALVCKLGAFATLVNQ